ncbi:MAG: hypothetical protein KJ731_18555 [Alphaproteobacteria bacterium]|nr:hypothetical protein [Alphaproteobacteria bacterium]MBU1277626.1 hypothetical protein [Alphaproteobacteria bacterium]MBU1575281.1 hypothetical protein [Alphaproteobacteria bacterium]MBU1830450.1 hypothetical protein [Alphaproteobacteria bacterium]MBU2242024.1 hypothetical protein [Alphaproteobacteria bacterium]
MLRYAWMAAIEGQPKTFNNHLGFELGFWQNERGPLSPAPEMRVCGELRGCDEWQI